MYINVGRSSLREPWSLSPVGPEDRAGTPRGLIPALCAAQVSQLECRGTGLDYRGESVLSVTLGAQTPKVTQSLG